MTKVRNPISAAPATTARPTATAHSRCLRAAQEVGPVLDMRKLSDEYVSGNGFTSAMVGFGCQDLRGDDAFADAEWFDYRTEEAE